MRVKKPVNTDMDLDDRSCIPRLKHTVSDRKNVSVVDQLPPSSSKHCNTPADKNPAINGRNFGEKILGIPTTPVFKNKDLYGSVPSHYWPNFSLPPSFGVANTPKYKQALSEHEPPSSTVRHPFPVLYSPPVNPKSNAHSTQANSIPYPYPEIDWAPNPPFLRPKGQFNPSF
ncbi:hypothetical protein K470DRAFT_268491 [Piedraia hortae CBS 480.64]|uniref:Uncharacterized protein n=1 Tax=Piedraia hortae CBS 480.64 TaxID=1314780 RepID=A0A6A7C650_9PEZI|nr:hypothetical protein K470DRAFT_268491 [Piedraia hortae CBS 480.64]